MENNTFAPGEGCTLEWVLSRDEKFRYQLLDRMRCDCIYFMDVEHHSDRNHLWAGNPKDQIDIMKKIWANFPSDGKPEWLTWEQIIALESDMEAVLRGDYQPKEPGACADTPEREYELPCTWMMSGTCKVTAKSWDEAVAKAKAAPLPDGEYISDSFSVDEPDDAKNKDSQTNDSA